MNVPITERPVASRVSYSRGDLAAVRLGGFAAVVGGVLMMVHEVAELVIGDRTTTDAPRSLLHTAWMAALFLAVRGVATLQRPVPGRLAHVLVRVALVGTGAMTMFAAAETVQHLVAPESVSKDPPAPVLVMLVALVVLLVTGMLAFAVSILRAGVLARSVGLLLLAGVLTKMVVPRPVPSLAILGLTVAWLGVALLRQPAADAPR